jgi:leucyl/phenylalanyl-tRNA--protein transferase
MRKTINFPEVETADENGLVTLGEDLEIDTLLKAYEKGIFPWPVQYLPTQKEKIMAWFSPDPRGILDFKEIHISRSLVKILKKNTFEVTFNQNFTEVINYCAQTIRKNNSDTWITSKIIESYSKLFKEKYAYSVEVWNKNSLAAGIYGVTIGDFVSGESMFTREDNASKLGLYFLIKHLEKKGLKWIDTQMVTPVVKQFGGKLIARKDFIKRLERINWKKNNSNLFII